MSGRLGGEGGVMQHDIVTKKKKPTSKRNRGLILKYTLFATLCCKLYSTLLQIFSKTPNTYAFFVTMAFVFWFGFVAIKSGARINKMIH